jgi:hypothetical protein
MDVSRPKPAIPSCKESVVAFFACLIRLCCEQRILTEALEPRLARTPSPLLSVNTPAPAALPAAGNVSPQRSPAPQKNTPPPAPKKIAPKPLTNVVAPISTERKAQMADAGRARSASAASYGDENGEPSSRRRRNIDIEETVMNRGNNILFRQLREAVTKRLNERAVEEKKIDTQMMKIREAEDLIDASKQKIACIDEFVEKTNGMMIGLV